ncbi:1,4-dihydroxy-2-naphthoate polyprenyltransferase, partial [Priestia megaterium]
MTSHNKENKAAVEQYSKGKILWQLTRPHTLTASFVPVLIGTV